jgi:hypothetical protein
VENGVLNTHTWSMLQTRPDEAAFVYPHVIVDGAAGASESDRRREFAREMQSPPRHDKLRQLRDLWKALNDAMGALRTVTLGTSGTLRDQKTPRVAGLPIRVSESRSRRHEFLHVGWMSAARNSALSHLDTHTLRIYISVNPDILLDSRLDRGPARFGLDASTNTRRGLRLARLIGGSTAPHDLPFHVHLRDWKCNESR